jgi:hypothetical protein
VRRLRAQWQQFPQDGVQRFCIGNMNRFVDIYTAKGQQLAQLGGDGITAVPAVASYAGLGCCWHCQWKAVLMDVGFVDIDTRASISRTLAMSEMDIRSPLLRH